ncbi:hypothetical protein GIB67_009625 [Kingdonia uniflora]|uniref:Single-strand DNA endonuclease 1 n=1 Tax=Kingdonia uniflora TaxID=39325 RepID=A0A7J7M2B1_9MAGN|nr:hypothetical protein GIB67_009625 [Kingdonia uniflora]
MGVKNLWDILESCKKTLPLHHLQNKRVCIDLSCWMVQLHSVCKTHSCIKDKVYLKNLFHRIRALIALNCRVVFVTDGSIPAIKLSTYRQRLGSATEVLQDEINTQKVSSLRRNMGSEFSCMIKEAKTLGLALGIPCLDGIEEAEAQCALLNSESLCDGCFSLDSDIFLFGAKTVYRDIDLGGGGYVVCYEMEDIEKKLGFGRNSLISVALLLGSDYTKGVHGLGRETACIAIKSAGDQNVLQQIVLKGFGKKTKKSKKQGIDLDCDANKENSLAYKQNNSDTNPPQNDQFVQVINAYMKPKCHSADSEAVYRALATYPFQRTKLQEICRQFFGWTPEKTDEYILPKIAERDLRRFANLRSCSSSLGVQLSLDKMPVMCPISAIIKSRKAQGKECFEVAWKDFDGLKSSVVHAELVESACPEKIAEFKERRAPKKKQNRRRLEEVDLKLQSLMLDIERTSHSVSTATLYPNPIVITEVVDLLSPSPPIRARKVSKPQETVISRMIDIIDLSESEPEMSPEHARKARELRLFISSID